MTSSDGSDRVPAKPRLLLAGGGHADIPLIQAAQRLGYHVTTSGDRPGDRGHAHGDAYEPADYSDPAAITALAERIGAEAICACCNDFSALSCAAAAAALGLPGHDPVETALTIHHKDRWRRYAAEHGVPSPRAIGAATVDEAMAALESIGFPSLVKPIDLSGGKGISRLDGPLDARGAVEAAFSRSKAGRVVIEEFVEGTRHGMTTILRDRSVVFSFADDEQYHLSPYLVSGASAPGSSGPAVRAELVEVAEAVADDLELADGIFHIQYIERTGRPVILEICRRAPGDLYVELVRHATGVPYAEWIVRAACGLPLDDVAPAPVHTPMSRHCLMAPRAGVFAGFDFAIGDSGADPGGPERIVDSMIWGEPGERIEDPAVDKLGIVFVAFPDAATARREAPRLGDRLRVCMR